MSHNDPQEVQMEYQLLSHVLEYNAPPLLEEVEFLHSVYTRRRCQREDRTGAPR
jgi:hypothetical protein